MEKKWTIADSRELYFVGHWGSPFFDINAHGNMTVSPKNKEGPNLDIPSLVEDLRRRGLQPPLLIRFNDVLDSRVRYIADAFQTSIETYDYRGSYQSLMPIKVNQQRHVVERIIEQDDEYRLGLEAGSKPEVLIATALLSHHKNELIVCNGYKDREYVDNVLDAQRLGNQPFLVLDRFAELDLVIEAARQAKLMPNIGIRARLTAKGAGRWESSSGDRSKFGLSAREIVNCIEKLKEANMLDALKLLHFHIGSQITAIRSVKVAAREASHLYCNIRKLGATNLSLIDVGGGLAVDYDGSKTNFHSSKNYSVQEYANDVVATLGDICNANDEPHPKILSESGRALVAHHSVLVFNVLGVHAFTNGTETKVSKPSPAEHHLIHDIWEAYDTLNPRNVQEVYHDLLALKEESATLFSHGVIDLDARARTEEIFWATAKRIHSYLQTLEYVPEDLSGLEHLLSDTYYCNFSIFQSLPDAWAVHHLFPIMPIHRLNEEPTKQAILADLTCDSDGKLDRFIDLRGNDQNTLKLHPPGDSPYYLGVFLVGAYQETLGDLHNLFGDTNAVHVNIRDDGSYSLEHVVHGDTVNQVLSYVEYDCHELLQKTWKAAERAVERGELTLEESAELMKRYQNGLEGYTYLED